MAKNCWDDVPVLPGPNGTECMTAAERAEEAAKNACICAQRAEDADLHSPIIQNGYWYVYDASLGEYVPTNVSASGADQVARDQITQILAGLGGYGFQIVQNNVVDIVYS